MSGNIQGGRRRPGPPVLALAVLAIVALTASCNSAPDLPPLPADPTEAEVAAHVARYCGRLQTCALDTTLGAECMAKMMDGAKTVEGRRGMAAAMNLWAPCMTMDCVSMTACFPARAIQAEKAKREHSSSQRTPHRP